MLRATAASRIAEVTVSGRFHQTTVGARAFDLVRVLIWTRLSGSLLNSPDAKELTAVVTMRFARNARTAVQKQTARKPG